MLTFIEAHKILAQSSVSDTRQFKLVSSAQLDKLHIFIKAQAILSQFQADYSTLPFNTLNQYLLKPDDSMLNVVVLFPWDFCPSLDWRLGFSPQLESMDSLLTNAHNFWERLNNFANKRIIYCDFPFLPNILNQKALKLLGIRLNQLAIENI